MSLQSILKEIKEIKHFAEEEVSESPRETYQGRIGRQRQAKEKLGNLKERYRQELLATSVFILVTGSEREAFVKTASDELKFFSVDADLFYKDLADRVSPSLYAGKELNSSVLDVLTRHLEDKAMEVGILGYPLIVFRQEYRRNIENRNDFVSSIKDIVGSQMGTEVVGIQAAKTIVDRAIELSHNANTTPILLSVDNEAEVLKLIPGLNRLSRRVYVVSAGKDDLTSISTYERCPQVSTETVSKTMKTLRAKIQGRSTEVVEEAAAAEIAADLPVGDQVLLSEEDAKKFVETLENPPEPTEALVNAVNKRRNRNNSNK